MTRLAGNISLVHVLTQWLWFALYASSSTEGKGLCTTFLSCNSTGPSTPPGNLQEQFNLLMFNVNQIEPCVKRLKPQQVNCLNY